MNSSQLFKTWSSFKALYGDFEYLGVFIDDIMLSLPWFVAVAARYMLENCNIYVGKLRWLPTFCYSIIIVKLFLIWLFFWDIIFLFSGSFLILKFKTCCSKSVPLCLFDTIFALRLSTICTHCSSPPNFFGGTRNFRPK